MAAVHDIPVREGSARVTRVPRPVTDAMGASTAARFLAQVFLRSGCFRVPNAMRQTKDGQKYRKGYEVRLPVNSKAELLRVRRCLKQFGIELGNAYSKRSQIVQVIYGKDHVATFARLLSRVGLDSQKIKRIAL